MSRLDVLVLGAGPAGFAVAGALVTRGLRVGIAAPELTEGPPAWAPTYCAWEDELAEVGFSDVADARWPGALATFGPDPAGDPRRHDLPRAYVRVDKTRLAARLAARAAGARYIRGRVEGAVHHPFHSEVAVGGDRVEATVVIDASGHHPALLRAAPRPAPAFQTAVGRLLDVRDPPWPRDRAVLIDYTPVAPDGAAASEGPPTFLYVLPLPDGRSFVEETVLAARPALGRDALRARLDRRLAALGVAGGTPEEEEWVWIPMGGALPHDPRVLGFGAAGGMVHPATGYLLPRVLGAADRVADALVAGLLGRGGPVTAVAAAREALWPRDLRLRRALYRFGLEALLGMDPPATRGFFDAFFHLPLADWSGYLSDRHDAAALRRVMWTLFRTAPAGLKWHLARAGLGSEGIAVAGELLGS